MGEVAYISMNISMSVERIHEIIPPSISADLTYVQGAERICEEIINKINQLPCKETRLASATRILAVYGSTGMGKTTLCRIMCNYFRQYCRVCHIQVGDGDLDILALQKSVLKQLTGASNTLLEAITNIDEGQYLLKKRINKQQVFLAIDNVCTTESSIHITRMILRLGLTKESLVLVTGRTYKDLLEVIGYDISGNCFHLPNLKEEEAIRILIERAIPNCSMASLPDLEQKIARYCTFFCQISCNIYSNLSTYQGQIVEYHYHPSSLIERGAQLGGNLNNWVHKLPFLSHFSELNNIVSKSYYHRKGLQYVGEYLESPYILSDSQRPLLLPKFVARINFDKMKDQLFPSNSFREYDYKTYTKNRQLTNRKPTATNLESLCNTQTSGAFSKYINNIWQCIKLRIELLLLKNIIKTTSTEQDIIRRTLR